MLLGWIRRGIATPINKSTRKQPPLGSCGVYIRNSRPTHSYFASSLSLLFHSIPVFYFVNAFARRVLDHDLKILEPFFFFFFFDNTKVRIVRIYQRFSIRLFFPRRYFSKDLYFLNWTRHNRPVNYPIANNNIVTYIQFNATITISKNTKK